MKEEDRPVTIHHPKDADACFQNVETKLSLAMRAATKSLRPKRPYRFPANRNELFRRILRRNNAK